MLNAARALSLNSDAGRKLPRVDALGRLYDLGFDPRHGQVIMIAGRSGSQKSGFALWWVDQMNLDTLYFSADMSAFTASSRIASTRTGLTSEEVERAVAEDGEHKALIMEKLVDSRITFSFGSPIRVQQIEDELDCYVELNNKLPDIIVFDNLMDFGGAESDYSEQMAVMQYVTELSRETKATAIIMHHASDKSWSATNNPFSPPSRDQIKGGLSEKPELSLSVALDPNSLDFNIAVVKQRMGAQDPTAKRWATLRCEPELTRFHSAGLLPSYTRG